MMKPNGKRKSGNGSHPSGCNSSPNFKPDVEVLKKPSNGETRGNGSLLRGIREEKGLSQRELANKSGIPRTSIQRLEELSWQAISLGELERLAQGLGVKPEELFVRFNGFGKENFSRSGDQDPFFVLDYQEGVRFASFLKNPKDHFMGSLTLDPQKTLGREDSPKGEFVFFRVLEGTLVLALSGKDHLFKSGQCFSLQEPSGYELYNPHQFEKLTALLVTIPPFIKSHA